eukprot:2328349-Pleurochrysis_carterae.AAC.2
MAKKEKRLQRAERIRAKQSMRCLKAAEQSLLSCMCVLSIERECMDVRVFQVYLRCVLFCARVCVHTFLCTCVGLPTCRRMSASVPVLAQVAACLLLNSLFLLQKRLRVALWVK